MATKQYRCIANELNIRSQPLSSDQFKTGQMLQRYEIITVDDADRSDADGFAWVKHARGWSAERSLDGKTVFLTDAVQPRDRIWGINIDPNNFEANPSPDRLAGVGWVRFPLLVDRRSETLEQAFKFYDPAILAYAQNNTRVILILLHDMYYGNRPWDNGNWLNYIHGFAERAGLIARHYKNRVAVYQIWNEGDVAGAETSHYIAPGDYANMLIETTQAIAQNDPAAQIISGGLASDLAKAIAYMRTVRDNAGGKLPIDGIAIHPYGQVPPDPDASPFPNWSHGLMEDYLSQFTGAFPGMPLWITEIGVPRLDVTNQAYWPRIANYMDKTITFVRDRFCHAVPAVVWFAWSDPMDRAGIVNAEQKAKGVLFNTFFKQVHASYPAYVQSAVTPFDGRITLAHTAGESLPDQSVDSLGVRMASAVPNVGALLIKASKGTAWLTGGTQGMAITWSGALGNWAVALSRYRIQLHAWHEIQGTNAANEISLIQQISRVPGVRSIVIDLNPATLALRDGKAIRAFMLQMRQALPAGYPLGLSFDGRPETFAAVNVVEWYPFIDSWHPRIYHLNFDGGTQGPVPYLTALFAALRHYPKPIIPMLQPARPNQARQGIRFATDGNGAPGVSFGNLASMTPDDFETVRGLYIPWLAGYITAPVFGTLSVCTNTTLRIRTTPSVDAETLDMLYPNEQITVLERKKISALEWVRHRRGWSVARDTAKNEVYLA
jgi:hypothetical protein